VVTFVSPDTLNDERWAIEVYARTQLTGRIRQASWRGWGCNGCGWA
jgi:hypothetical protein